MSGTLKVSSDPRAEKYKGDPANIIYRSSWERIFMNWCDTKDGVISWQRREVPVV